MASQTSQKLSLAALTAMVVGSMIGAGIFALPRTFGAATGPIGAVIAWCIAGAGMYTLALVFQALAARKPELDAGIFSYAKAGFGDYAGFLSAFGYWLVACIADVSYWVLIKSTLGAFFPVFGNGDTVPAVVVSSIALWLFHFTILRGIREAAFINTVVTVAKVIPILVFILILAGTSNANIFVTNLWGGELAARSGLFEQIRATMLVTIFVFIGIEGASVYSRYAKDRADVGRATIIGFIGVLFLLVLVTLLPYAVLPQAEIAGLRQPSMAAVLEAVVGHWGAVFVSVGLIVSLLGAYLAWSLICVEVLFAAARSGDMPRIFARENRNNVPAAALWLTNVIIQAFLISTLFSQDAFALMVKLSSAMVLIPYLLVAGYGFLLALRRETYDTEPAQRSRDLIVAGIATLYVAFMIYAGGLKFLLLSSILYAPGTLLYVQVRREQNMPVLVGVEWIVLAAAAIGCLVGIYGIASGDIVL
ncbi:MULTISPECIES: basic amino acid/polyamine antiporter [Mesorhizobium]|uniref:Arginine-ornithine antiporter n=2 Tax=Mesorhizobium TaxID=68287 RepID=A0A1A5HRX5_RHILI|nr:MULTISPECIES: basic amino acid/polyamine antiporter [Mesorhizobium]ETA71369.1 arginine:ornithine antiporter, APA family [Mesorhizobium japonicum R7A]MBE1711767.1 amino acid permease [Mesorhizobium japonicum]MBE1717681.1 amino acid permease [Mesorhizobium japonicum]MUT23588.1 amino acid permease [Mesorhizobium japonicum]MUT30380.1 amino acid permease [Mesorhizobium japonicum]